MTVSVMVWRAIFSVCTVTTGSFFRKAQYIAAPARAMPTRMKKISFLRPLRRRLGASAGGGKIGGVSTRRACRNAPDLSSAGIVWRLHNRNHNHNHNPARLIGEDFGDGLLPQRSHHAIQFWIK